MKIKNGLTLGATLILGLLFAIPSWAQEACKAPLPDCVNVMTLTDTKIVMQNQCRYDVAVRVYVLHGLGGGISMLNANGQVYTLDEGTLFQTDPKVKPRYAKTLHCCQDIEDHYCTEPPGQRPGPM